MIDCCTLYVTCKNREEAKDICKFLLNEKLVACGNIIGGVASIYQWQGEICEDREAILFLKTTKEKSEEVIQIVKERHSYEVPCICVWDIKDGNSEYLEWLSESVR